MSRLIEAAVSAAFRVKLVVVRLDDVRERMSDQQIQQGPAIETGLSRASGGSSQRVREVTKTEW